MPTTITTELRPSGGDYTSVGAWQTDHGGATSKDLITNDEAVVLEFYKGDYTSLSGGVDFIDEEVTFSGWTADDFSGDNTITLTAPASERHDGTPGSGIRWRRDAGFGECAKTSGTPVIFEYLEFFTTRTGTITNLCEGSVNSDALWSSCIFEGNGAGTALAPSERADRCVENCIFINWVNGLSVAGFVYFDIYNCTFADCTTAIHCGTTDYNLFNVVNCVSFNCTNFYNDADAPDDFDTLTGYNASSDYSGAPPPPDKVGSSDYTSDVVSGDFEDTANDDYHLSSGSNLIGIGYDFSGTFTSDIDGDTRPTGSAWDIGADHFVSGVAVVFIPKVMWI